MGLLESVRRRREPKPQPEYIEFQNNASKLIDLSLQKLVSIPEFCDQFTHVMLGIPKQGEEASLKSILVTKQFAQRNDFTVSFATKDMTVCTVMYRLNTRSVDPRESLDVVFASKGESWSLQLESVWFSKEEPLVDSVGVRINNENLSSSVFVESKGKNKGKGYYPEFSKNTMEEVVPKAKELLNKLPTPEVVKDS